MAEFLRGSFSTQNIISGGVGAVLVGLFEWWVGVDFSLVQWAAAFVAASFFVDVMIGNVGE